MKRLLILSFAILSGCGTIPSTPTWFPAPDKPDGPKIGYVGQKITFTTEGTDPLDVHEFQWDWGDGSQSDWDSDNEECKHKFLAPGMFEVKARERCPLYLFQTDWSDGRKITITPPTTQYWMKVP